MLILAVVRRLALPLFCAAVATPSTIAAQGTRTSPAAQGEWTIEYQRSVRRLRGEPFAFTERATLSLRVRADSILGELTVLADPGSDPSAPRPLRGTFRGDSLILESGPRTDDSWMDALARWLHANMPAFPRLALVVQGDRLAGTRSVLSPDGHTESAPAPVSGWRRR